MYPVQRNAEAIYWFADFADRLDEDTIKSLTRSLKRNRTKVITHNFLGTKVHSLAKEMSESTGGQAIELIPGS